MLTLFTLVEKQVELIPKQTLHAPTKKKDEEEKDERSQSAETMTYREDPICFLRALEYVTTNPEFSLPQTFIDSIPQGLALLVPEMKTDNEIYFSELNMYLSSTAFCGREETRHPILDRFINEGVIQQLFPRLASHFPEPSQLKDFISQIIRGIESVDAHEKMVHVYVNFLIFENHFIFTGFFSRYDIYDTQWTVDLTEQLMAFLTENSLYGACFRDYQKKINDSSYRHLPSIQSIWLNALYQQIPPKPQSRMLSTAVPIPIPSVYRFFASTVLQPQYVPLNLPISGHFGLFHRDEYTAETLPPTEHNISNPHTPKR